MLLYGFQLLISITSYWRVVINSILSSHMGPIVCIKAFFIYIKKKTNSLSKLFLHFGEHKGILSPDQGLCRENDEHFTLQILLYNLPSDLILS